MSANEQYRTGEPGLTEPHQGRMQVLGGRIALLLVLPFTLILYACPMFDPAAFLNASAAKTAEAVSTTATQITLAWDPPSTGATIASYTVSYRPHGTTTWTVLGTVTASDAPSYTVLHSTVGSGEFDFAVSATDSAGDTSALHTSLDSTADPDSGWYIVWGQ